VAEFEKASFSLPKGAVSDLVKTQFGFHIIKVIDRENAHTKPFEDVRDSLRGPLVLQKADQLASEQADKIAAVIRRSNLTPLDDVAKQFNLSIAETRPVSATDPLLELGSSQEVKETVFRLRLGELGQPIRTDRGYVVVSVKEIRPAHPGAFAEVRDKVLTDWKRDRSAELAKSKAEELAKRLKSGESAQAAAKALDLEAKTSELLTRSGSIPGAASRQLSDAFRMSVGQSSAAVGAGANWLVYRVAAREEPNPADFDKQRRELEQQVLQAKRSLAFSAFQSALDARLKQEGKLKVMPERLKGFGSLQEPLS
jgi:peptidyl-prolyl cis-trans isomerase D